MNTTKETILATLDSLIDEGRRLLTTSWTQTHLGDLAIANPTTYVEIEPCYRWHAGCANLARILGDIAAPWATKLNEQGNKKILVESRLGVLQGIKSAVEADLLAVIESLVRAELFDDLLSQADYLFSNGYCPAAGVLGRAVLEEHLRRWCVSKACLPTVGNPTVNSFKDALYTGKHLDKIAMKQVEAMAAIGNECAHKPSTVNRDDVERLLRDVREFLVRHTV